MNSLLNYAKTIDSKYTPGLLDKKKLKIQQFYALMKRDYLIETSESFPFSSYAHRPEH